MKNSAENDVLNKLRIHSSRDIVQWVVFLFLFVGIYFSAVGEMVKRWNHDDYTYCYLIPAIVAYLIFESRKNWITRNSETSWCGIGVLAMGLLLLFVGELAGEPFSTRISLCVVILSFFWILWGWRKLKIVLFPLLFLFGMIPLPYFFHNSLSLKLKMLSSKYGVWMMQLYGMTAYREGNIIDLGFTKLQVVDACNGIRYLIPLVIMSVLLAYLYKLSVWKKVIIVASAIPISIVVNSLRIASVGVLYQFFGPAAAEGFFHDFSGWFIFMFSLALLLVEMWLLNKVCRENNANQKQDTKNTSGKSRLDKLTERPAGESSDFDTAKARAKSGQGGIGTIFSPQFAAAVLILAISWGLVQTLEFREKLPIKKPLEYFPTQVGGWAGKRISMEQHFLEELDLSSYAIISYQNGVMPQVNCYIAYYESQRSGASIHSPSSCLPGAGWATKDSGSTTLQFNGQNTMTINRAIVKKGDSQQLVYYWFPMRGRNLTDIYQMKIYNFWDALIRQRTDGALVRITTPISRDESIDSADKRLQSFLGPLVPVLNEHLPQ